MYKKTIYLVSLAVFLMMLASCDDDVVEVAIPSHAVDNLEFKAVNKSVPNNSDFANSVKYRNPYSDTYEPLPDDGDYGQRRKFQLDFYYGNPNDEWFDWDNLNYTEIYLENPWELWAGNGSEIEISFTPKEGMGAVKFTMPDGTTHNMTSGGSFVWKANFDSSDYNNTNYITATCEYKVNSVTYHCRGLVMVNYQSNYKFIDGKWFEY